ncbi:MAG: cupin domain-containing protein [Cyanobacteria bacterium J06631_2]
MTSQTTEILVISQPNREQLDKLDVWNWSIWTKEVSEFPWTYDEAETCYFLTGDVVVTPDGGEPVAMGKGDLVTFPAGMSCTWQINSAVKKHYQFGS